MKRARSHTQKKIHSPAEGAILGGTPLLEQLFDSCLSQFVSRALGAWLSGLRFVFGSLAVLKPEVCLSARERASFAHQCQLKAPCANLEQRFCRGGWEEREEDAETLSSPARCRVWSARRSERARVHDAHSVLRRVHTILRREATFCFSFMLRELCILQTHESCETDSLDWDLMRFSPVFRPSGPQWQSIGLVRSHREVCEAPHYPRGLVPSLVVSCD